MKRGDGDSCTYHGSTNTLERERERRLRAEIRLESLERLVHQLARHEDGTAALETAPSRPVAGQQVVREESNIERGALASGQLVFNGSTHWSAMLENIEGLRSAILPTEASQTGRHIPVDEENAAASLILGSAGLLPLQQVLIEYLPPRQEADCLTAAYFRSNSVSAPFIHSAQFLRLYQKFWANPTKGPPLWTSILFSICHIARNSLALGQGAPSADNKYIVASAHCLGLGQYFRPKEYSVESLLLFVQAKCLTNLDISSDTSLIFGLLIRLATTMGYHGELGMFQLSTFERQMRRRTWSLCMQLDLLISYQLGLPSNIQFPTWDTQPPRNLLDSDFDEHTKELPLARPDSEPTNISFYIAKHKLMTVFEKILRHTLSTEKSESSDVDELDTEIRDTYSALPETLHPRAMADAIVDSPSLIVTRLCVFFLYQKCLCVLHRPYVTRGQAYSTQICSDAALNIVRHFHDTYKEFLPGGQLETERWFLGNITWQDYLLGVMALCMVLCANSQSIVAPQVQPVEVLHQLERAREVCVEQAERSKDSSRVRKVVDTALQRFGSLGTHNDSTTNGSSFSIDPFESSLMQSPFAGDTAGHGDISLSHFGQHFSLEQVEPDMAGWETLAGPIDKTSWAYLGQFLNLSDDDLMPNT